MRWKQWIWSLGCAAWTMDGILALRYPNKQHAVLAFMLAVLFAIAGAFFRTQQR